ncbi:MAG: DUF1595 domain-containing protein [Nannocystaceae bacterium]
MAHPEAPELGGVGQIGMRRLSVDEYDNTIADLLGDDTRPGATLLAEDVADPYDNQISNQQANRPLIEALEQLAGEITSRLLEDTGRRDMVVGCQPTATTDEACLSEFTARFGRRALRRPLSDEEVARYVDLGLQFAADEDDFYAGVGVILRVFLQDPEFVYRVEVGTQTDEPGVFRLSSFEVATRLSYFLWGTTPSDELLDRARPANCDRRGRARDRSRDDRGRARDGPHRPIPLAVAGLLPPAAFGRADHRNAHRDAHAAREDHHAGPDRLALDVLGHRYSS